MKMKILLIVLISISFTNVFGQKKVYQSNPAKEVTEKLGITLTESRAGFVYYTKSSNKLMPYLALVFRNNTKIQRKRHTGSLRYQIKKDGVLVKKSFKWGKTITPIDKEILFLIYDVNVQNIPDDDYNGYTIECWFEDSENKESIYKIGEFKFQKINFELTWREDFVYYDGQFFQNKIIPFEKL